MYHISPHNILTSKDHESLGNDHRKETTLKFYSQFFSLGYVRRPEVRIYMLIKGLKEFNLISLFLS